MRTAIVNKNFIGRYSDKETAKTKANELGGRVCHLILQNSGLQATFGFAVEMNNEILGCDEFKWI